MDSKRDVLLFKKDWFILKKTSLSSVKMGNKKPKNLPNFNPFAIEKKNLQQIQEIAFYNVFDAFEINEALKILQITRQKIETSIIRPAAKKIEPYKKKFTKFKDYAV